MMQVGNVALAKLILNKMQKMLKYKTKEALSRLLFICLIHHLTTPKKDLDLALGH